MADEKKNGVPFGIVSPNPPRDMASEAEGVRALLSDLPPPGKEREAELIQGRMENGVRTISYSFDAERPQHLRHQIIKYATNVQALDNTERDKVREGLYAIEKIANIRFCEASPEEKEQADIRYFKGKITDKETSGYMIKCDQGREIMLDNEHSDNVDTALHETLHALGLSHPDANGKGGMAEGKNPLYSKDTTVMSYNWGRSPVNSLGPFDVAALQFLYGKPPPEEEPQRVTAEGVTDMKFLFGQLPLTVDLRGDNRTGDLVVNTDKGIVGFINDSDGQSSKDVVTRLVSSTRIKDVLTSPETQVNLVIVGNELPNRLQGGNDCDALTAHGGNDILTGRDGADRFIFDDKSGFHNIITDLEPSDTIDFKPAAIAMVEIKSCDGKNTGITARDSAGKPMTSVYILNATPEQVAERILRVRANAGVFRVELLEAHYDINTPQATSTPIIRPKTNTPNK